MRPYKNTIAAAYLLLGSLLIKLCNLFAESTRSFGESDGLTIHGVVGREMGVRRVATIGEATVFVLMDSLLASVVFKLFLLSTPVLPLSLSGTVICVVVALLPSLSPSLAPVPYLPNPELNY